MNKAIVVYSHTDSSQDVWKLLNDSAIKNICNDYPCYMCTNYTELSVPDVFRNVIYYDDGLSYVQKLIYIFTILLEKGIEYIMLFHDNDLLYNINCETLSSAFYLTEKINIDRLILGIVGYIENTESTNDISYESIRLRKVYRTMKTCIFDTPYDVGPSIWKIASYKHILNMVSSYTSYRDIEGSPIQQILSKYNIYGMISRADSIGQNVHREHTTNMDFIHIIYRHKWGSMDRLKDVYKKYLLEQIYKHNIDINDRGIINI